MKTASLMLRAGGLRGARGASGILLLGLLAGSLVDSAALAEIPAPPAAQNFLHDFAGVLSGTDRQQIISIQERVYNQVQVPLVVVTINRMSDYEPNKHTIESFATKWFNTWGIGTPDKDDGILVIISTGDRKGRIELGGAWARRFDSYCQRVMDNEMIPEFKRGNYSGGLAGAVSTLSDMALSGPDATPPAPGFADKYRHIPFVALASQENPIEQMFGVTPLVLLFLLGVGCLVAAYFQPQNRKWLIIVGISLIAFAVIFWIALVVIWIFVGGKGSSGSSGGGGFGGGSSGGGGASGSW